MELISLSSDEVHLWIARDPLIDDAGLLVRYWNLLEPDERAQQQRFLFARHRHQYLVTRALVRCVLSRYVDGVAPEQWRFHRNDYGKPAILNSLAKPLQFNLSHSDGMVVLAVTAAADIGVDVEWLLRSGDTIGIADSYFSPLEMYQLHQLPTAQQRGRFFDFWTLKEAYIKACGMGLSIPLDHFSYVISGAGLVDVVFEAARNDDPAHWQFWQLDPGSEHKIALACRMAPRRPLSLTVREMVPLYGDRPATYPITHSLPSLSSRPEPAF